MDKAVLRVLNFLPVPFREQQHPFLWAETRQVLLKNNFNEIVFAVVFYYYHYNKSAVENAWGGFIVYGQRWYTKPVSNGSNDRIDDALKTR